MKVHFIGFNAVMNSHNDTVEAFTALDKITSIIDHASDPKLATVICEGDVTFEVEGSAREIIDYIFNNAQRDTVSISYPPRKLRELK